jgi:nucleoside-diphosphate-sugar epimerase
VRLVHASSIAVYGMPLPPQIDDGTQPWPTLSYGAHKLAGELLVNDLSRRGLVDGRSLRLSGVIVRPAQPNGALSAFNSDIFRETLAGRPVVSPVSPAATIWVQTIGRTVDNLLHAAALEPAAFGRQRAVLLPALACRIDEIVAAIAEVAGPEARQLVSYRPDERVEPMFGRWPKPFTATRGRDLGFTADEDLVSMVRGFAAARMGSA